MTKTDVTFVRIYCTEAEHKLDSLLKLLHDEAKVAGVTAFRGIAGFGRSGEMHSSSFLDVSFDLPVVVEFFDLPEKVTQILAQVYDHVDPGHVVSWAAQADL